MKDKTQNSTIETRLNRKQKSAPVAPFYPFAARRFRFLFLSFLLLFAFSQTNYAQMDDKEAPPPLKMLSKDEKSQLDAETNVKKRTKLSLELMEARLAKAEGLSKSEDYQAMFNELGAFHALMDNALNFLKKKDSDSGKVLNNFKRMELSLRKYLTRIELIHRDVPTKFEPYVRRLAVYVRNARTAAVEPLFEDTVLQENELN